MPKTKLTSCIVIAIIFAISPSHAQTQSQTQRHDRGPKVKIIRPPLSQFDHVQFEKKGPLGVSEIAQSVWSGTPVYGVSMPPSEGPILLPHESMTWADMQAEEDARFDRMRYYNQSVN